MKFQLSDDSELTARILTVDDSGVDVEVPGVKGRKPTAKRLAFEDITKARVQVEFNRKSKPDDQHEQDEQEALEENAEEA